MTGYGSKVVESENKQITIEMRTVNHRFLDISVHMPRELLYLEASIKDIIKSIISRGSVDVYVRYDKKDMEHQTLKVDWGLLNQYMEQMNRSNSYYKLNQSIQLSNLLQLRGVFNIEEEPIEVKRLESSLLHGMNNVAEHVLEMRRSEGENLQKAIIQEIEKINEAVLYLRKNRESVMQHYAKRIQTRIEQFVDDPDYLEEGRLQKEIAVLAEKGDITEELTRIDSHIDHFTQSIHSAGPIGRTLDFITQEMQREVNTVASKSQDAKMNQQIILMK